MQVSGLACLVAYKVFATRYVFSEPADRKISIILQKNRSPVVPKQNVVQDYVSLSLQKYRVPKIAGMNS